MKKNKFYLLLSLAILLTGGLMGCKEKSTYTEEEKFPINYSTNYKLTHGAPFEISFSELDEISEINLFIQDSLYQSWNVQAATEKGTFDITNLGLGSLPFTLKVKDKAGKEYTENQAIQIVSDIVPEDLTAETIRLIPHDASHFTQGLEIVDGILYESTGDPEHIGATKIYKKNLTSGAVLQEVNLEGNYFGEGITIFKDKLYQLTWTSQACFIYDFPSLEKTNNKFTYTGEGWGLTHDGKSLIMSDGSERIYYRDPTTFAIQKIINVYDNVGPIKQLNELEYVDGIIYANIWMKNKIVGIDAKTGKVLQYIDCTDFTSRARDRGEVLNGIAYDHTTKKFYITGKYWSYMGEVVFK